MVLHIPIILGAWAVKAAVAKAIAVKAGTVIATKTGAAAVGKAAAGVAVKAGATQAAASTVATTVTGVTLVAGGSALATGGAQLAGRYQVWKGGQFGEKVRDRCLRAKQQIDEIIASARLRRDLAIHFVNDRAASPLSRYGDALAQIDLSTQPVVKEVLREFDSIPQPDHLKPGAPPAAESIRALAEFEYERSDVARMNSLMHSQHPANAIYYLAAKPLAAWVKSGFEYWDQACEYRKDAESHCKEEIERYDSWVNANHEAAATAKRIATGSERIVNVYAAVPNQLASDKDKPWEALNDAERTSIVRLKGAYDEALLRLRASVAE